MPPVLKRPTRPFPRRFRRPVSDQTRSFVQRRHQRVRQHRQERWKRWVRRAITVARERFTFVRRWLPVVLLAVLALVFCLLLFSPIIRVREIRVARSEGRVDVRAVAEALSPLYGWHLLFLPAHEVVSRVRSVVPDASGIEVRKEYPSLLSVHITLVPVVARLSIQSPGQVPASGSGTIASGSGAAVAVEYDYLAENGMYVSAPDRRKDSPLPTLRVVDWGVRPVPGMLLITPEFLDRMRRAEQALSREFAQQIRTRTIFLRAREFHLDTPSISFWFDVRSPLEQQLGRLRSFLRSVKFKDVKSYVDLRLTGRVVYK